ncbi:MAG: TIGR02391 family protein [Acidimicrobiia bacterium]
MSLPTPPDERHQAAIEGVYTLFQANSRWPTFAELDRHMDQRGEPNVEEILVSMPEGLLLGVSPASAQVRDEQEVGLSVAALACCLSAEEDLDVFLRIIRFAVTMEQDANANQQHFELLAGDVREAIRLPAAGRNNLLERAGALLRIEHWGWTQASGEGPEWSFVFNRRVRRLRGFASVDEYWERTRNHPKPPPQATSPSVLAPIESGASDGQIAWAFFLHPEIERVALPRFVAGHRDNAVEEACKLVAEALRKVSGLSMDGIDLVNRTLGSKGTVRLGDPESDQGRNEHDGYSDLLRGLMRIGRNLRAHRPSNPEADETEVASLLLLASLCLRRLDQYEHDQRDPDSESMPEPPS